MPQKCMASVYSILVMLIGDMSGSCAVLLNASVLHVLFSAAKIRQIICISKFFTEKLTLHTYFPAERLQARRLVEVKPTLLILLFVFLTMI